MISDDVVPGEAQYAKEAGLPSSFSTIDFLGECVRGSLETSKLEILEANFGLSSVSR